MVISYFLAVETSQERGSLAIGKFKPESRSNYEILALKEWPTDGSAKASHSESLNQFCVDLLNDTHLTLEDLSLLIVNIGPGSFTGVRVGINFIRTLSYSLSIPIYPVCSLAILANQEFQKGADIAEAVLPSLGTEFYYARYQKNGVNWTELEQPQLKQGCVTPTHPSPWSVKDLVACAFARPVSEQCDWKMLSPLYLRGSQAEEKMKRNYKT